MQDDDTVINTIINLSIHHVLQCITIIGCIDLNNMTYIHTYNLKLQVVLSGIRNLKSVWLSS